jgi:hypothetical protein
MINPSIAAVMISRKITARLYPLLTEIHDKRPWLLADHRRRANYMAFVLRLHSRRGLRLGEEPSDTPIPLYFSTRELMFLIYQLQHQVKDYQDAGEDNLLFWQATRDLLYVQLLSHAYKLALAMGWSTDPHSNLPPTDGDSTNGYSNE